MIKEHAFADILIIGGGFYGCFIALTLKKKYKDKKIVIVEKEREIMQKASKNNQARLHAGYLFPKNLISACNFLVLAPKFIYEFRKAIIGKFVNIYAISKSNSSISSNQFIQNFKAIKAPIKETSSELSNLFNKDFIEKSFIVKEKVFDSNILKSIIEHNALRAKIVYLLTIVGRSIDGSRDFSFFRLFFTISSFFSPSTS